MKKNSFLFILIFFSFLSCTEKKELSLFNKWELIDGVIHVENMDTGEKSYYDHFSPDKNKSQLTYTYNPDYKIEVIERNITTWEFKDNCDVIINDDRKNILKLQVNGDMMSILDNNTNSLGGSSRPFQAFTEDYKNGIIKIIIQKQYNIPDRVSWTNELYFKKIKK